MKKNLITTLLVGAILGAAYMCMGAGVTHTLGELSSLKDYTTRLWATNDTLSNADTINYKYTVKGSKTVNTITVKLTEYGAGTVAGDVFVYGSIDGGTTWFQVATDTLTDGSQKFKYALQHNDYQDWWVQVITEGTQTSFVQANVLYRQ